MKKSMVLLLVSIIITFISLSSHASLLICNEMETELQYAVEIATPFLLNPFAKKTYKVYLIDNNDQRLISDKGLDNGTASYIEWGNYSFNPDSPRFEILPPTPNGYENFRLIYYKSSEKNTHHLIREMSATDALPTKNLKYTMDCTKQ